MMVKYFLYKSAVVGCIAAALLIFISCGSEKSDLGVNKSTTASDGRTDKKVLLIGIDGVRIDVLKKVPTPNIDSLIANGFIIDNAQTRMPTVSGPGWSSMLTGVWSDKHGVKGNRFKGKNYSTYPDFLTRLEQEDSDYSTFSATTWGPLGSSLNGGPLISDSVDVKMIYNAKRIGGYPQADAQAVRGAVHHIKEESPDAGFVYIGNPDVVAHRLGPLTPEYRNALQQADSYVGKIVDTIRNRESYEKEDWLILMSTDHGHVDDGGHGGSSQVEKTIFYLLSSSSAQKEPPTSPVYIVDIAVTALRHMNVSIHEKWQLDGKNRGLELEESHD